MKNSLLLPILLGLGILSSTNTQCVNTPGVILGVACTVVAGSFSAILGNKNICDLFDSIDHRRLCFEKLHVLGLALSIAATCYFVKYTKDQWNSNVVPG